MEKYYNTIIDWEYIYACAIELNEWKLSLNRNLKPTKLLVIEKKDRDWEKYFIFKDEKWKEVKPHWTKYLSNFFYMFDNLEEAKERYKIVAEKIKKELENNFNNFLRIKEETLKKIELKK